METFHDPLESIIDLSGMLPPLPLEVSRKVFGPNTPTLSGQHTYTPYLLTRVEFETHVLPKLKESLEPELVSFIEGRVYRTFELRHKLKTLQKEIEDIVGAGHFSALWLDREAFSSDSMEHRALVTEAVIHVYSAEALQRVVTLLYRHKIPMIPYGEGGGYSMGVTPMAPAVTISVRGIDHISDIRPCRRNRNRFEISVGAGVPFKDLVAYLERRGYVLRCDPNTPRAATGGIAATGSNGGRKAFEVVVHGRAVGVDGTALAFGTDEHEEAAIRSEPFLMARKFFSVENLEAFGSQVALSRKLNRKASVTLSSNGVSIPLMGIKAEANMHAQRAQHLDAKDDMSDLPHLPLSTFVGAEGCTGFIYEVTFEIERPLPYLKGARWHFTSTEAAMAATRAIKGLSEEQQPSYFEVITGASIRSYLLQDFPTVFSTSDEAVLILGIEGKNPSECEKHYQQCLDFATTAITKFGESKKILAKIDLTNVLMVKEGIAEFELMRKPREELPKKLRTKCKTDMEIRTEYLGDVLKLVAATSPRALADSKRDVLFGHLTPRHTAIIHWNIGGFDLYDEEQADVAWDYLEKVIGKAQNLAPQGDPHGSARFTGEHGLAGKAPFLWLHYIPEQDFKRMCAVKDILDPDDLFNPDTIFLRNSRTRSLRARLLAASDEKLRGLRIPEEHPAEAFALTEALKCTRCTSCKICPVIDAEHELSKKNKTTEPVLPSKRNILMFLEHVVMSRRAARTSGDRNLLNTVTESTNAMLEQSAALLKKCFYCRRCDKACPVDIEIHPLMRAYHAMGKLPTMGSRFWGFLYERLMGEDTFKQLTYRVLAFFILLGRPFLALLRRLPLVPDWFKTYTAPPTLSLAHYEPRDHGKKLKRDDNFVVIESSESKNSPNPSEIYIRYRGCMDTFGNPQATVAVDDYFKSVLNVRIVDLEKKMCCGFPFEADGLHERAKQTQFLSLVEITRCIVRLLEEGGKSEKGEIGVRPHFVVFSNCPTCCEAIREMRAMLKDDVYAARLRSQLGLAADFDLKQVHFEVEDTAEIAVRLLERDKVTIKNKIKKTAGLKVPCHNTKAATAAQLKLLNMYYTGVAAYDKCCGLSGTGRLKHPKIGTVIAEKLFEQIEDAPAEVVVSGCPSCRDGVKMQRDIVRARSEGEGKFEVTGLFEQIQSDFFARLQK